MSLVPGQPALGAGGDVVVGTWWWGQGDKGPLLPGDSFQRHPSEGYCRLGGGGLKGGLFCFPPGCRECWYFGSLNSSDLGGVVTLAGPE